MQYVQPNEAKDMHGMRLALTVGVPGPWSESAKGIFYVKGIEYAPVAQLGGLPNEELAAWTGHANAPVAVYEDEPPRAGWAEILMLAERLVPEPALVPDDPAARAEVLGISFELCGENGYGWCRRLMMMDGIFARGTEATDVERDVGRVLGERYGYSKEAAERAPERVARIMAWLAGRLKDQASAGSRYLVGDSLTAADIYWACFAAIVKPLPNELCPIPDMIRAWYEKPHPALDEASDPILFEHREFIYQNHLELPLDF